MGWTIAVCVLAGIALAEAIALAVLWSRLQASRQEADELRRQAREGLEARLAVTGPAPGLARAH